MPAIVYDLQDLHGDESVFTIACRYLNSGFPIVVAGGGHAFVLVGYRRVPGSGNVVVELIRQDDQKGPYRVVTDPNLDRYRPWEYLVIPLPPKVYVSGEKAEAVGSPHLREALRAAANPASAALAQRISAGETVFRTTAMKSNDFKIGLKDPIAPDDLTGAYQWTHMSRWVWVVEAVDRAALDAGDPCVEAEVLIDATDHTGDPHPLAWRLPGQLFVWDPDRNRVDRRPIDPAPLLPSVSRVDGALSGNANP